MVVMTEDNRVRRYWKVLAIIFIILFLLETSLFVMLAVSGLKETERNNDCYINVCGDYDAYTYDYATQVCSCYRNNEVAFTSYIR